MAGPHVLLLFKVWLLRLCGVRKYSCRKVNRYLGLPQRALFRSGKPIVLTPFSLLTSGMSAFFLDRLDFRFFLHFLHSFFHSFLEFVTHRIGKVCQERKPVLLILGFNYVFENAWSDFFAFFKHQLGKLTDFPLGLCCCALPEKVHQTSCIGGYDKLCPDRLR